MHQSKVIAMDEKYLDSFLKKVRSTTLIPRLAKPDQFLQQLFKGRTRLKADEIEKETQNIQTDIPSSCFSIKRRNITIR